MSRIYLNKISRFIQEAVEKEVFWFVPCVATCEYPETGLESASLPGSSREATQLCKKDRWRDPWTSFHGRGTSVAVGHVPRKRPGGGHLWRHHAHSLPGNFNDHRQIGFLLQWAVSLQLPSIHVCVYTCVWWRNVHKFFDFASNICKCRLYQNLGSKERGGPLKNIPPSRILLKEMSCY